MTYYVIYVVQLHDFRKDQKNKILTYGFQEYKPGTVLDFPAGSLPIYQFICQVTKVLCESIRDKIAAEFQSVDGFDDCFSGDPIKIVSIIHKALETYFSIFPMSTKCECLNCRVLEVKPKKMCDEIRVIRTVENSPRANGLDPSDNEMDADGVNFEPALEIKTARQSVPALSIPPFEAKADPAARNDPVRNEPARNEPKKELEEGEVDTDVDIKLEETDNVPEQEQKMKQISLQYLDKKIEAVYVDLKKRLPKDPGPVRQVQLVTSDHHKIILSVPSKYYCRKKPDNTRVIQLTQFYPHYCIEAKRNGAIELNFPKFQKEVEKLLWCVRDGAGTTFVFPFQRIASK